MAPDLATLDLAGLRAEAERLGYVADHGVGIDGRPAHVWRKYRDGRPLAWRLLSGQWMPSGEPDERGALLRVLAWPSAQARRDIVDAAEARGRAAERADVVAWLRLRAARMMPDFADVVQHLTDIIASGGHCG